MSKESVRGWDHRCTLCGTISLIYDATEVKCKECGHRMVFIEGGLIHRELTARIEARSN